MAVQQVSEAGMARFLDDSFGMFIHWGLYSILARGEWVMHHEHIVVDEYEQLTRQFNPLKFNAEEWVSVAADAGQKYMVITSRHHDGFSMYDTALSDYKVTNTPFQRDPIRELADACARRSDIRLGFYSSLLDWRHPAYRFRRESGLAWDDYLAFLHGQVRELCTQFGELACIWFDGDWPGHLINEENEYFLAGGSFEYERLYNMIHELQPQAVIQNNRHARPLRGEDIQGFEQDLPGENTAGFNTTKIYHLPVEVCMTINDNWGVHYADENHKSVRRLVHVLVKSAAMGGNYLLNVGPTAEGEILPAHIDRLRKVGGWLKKHGEAIYGTRAGLVTGPGIASTRRGDTHYVHVLDYASDYARLSGVPVDVRSAALLDGSPVKMFARDEELILVLPEELRDPYCTVVKLS
ncbi:MAG TPA: alpha-L-fucosidase [Levilinea sp.]|nr:alpha-L-fucosidase [Levilinea sp.]